MGWGICFGAFGLGDEVRGQILYDLTRLRDQETERRAHTKDTRKSCERSHLKIHHYPLPLR